MRFHVFGRWSLLVGKGNWVARVECLLTLLFVDGNALLLAETLPEFLACGLRRLSVACRFALVENLWFLFLVCSALLFVLGVVL